MARMFSNPRPIVLPIDVCPDIIRININIIGVINPLDGMKISRSIHIRTLIYYIFILRWAYLKSNHDSGVCISSKGFEYILSIEWRFRYCCIFSRRSYCYCIIQYRHYWISIHKKDRQHQCNNTDNNDDLTLTAQSHVHSFVSLVHSKPIFPCYTNAKY